MIKFSHKILVSVLCLLACLPACILDAYRVVGFFLFRSFYHPLFRMEICCTYICKEKGYSEIEYNDDDGYDNDDDAMAPKRYYRHSSFCNRCVHTHKIHTTPARVLSITYSHKNCKKLTQKTFDNKYSSTLFVKPPPSNFLLLLRVFLMLIRKGQKIYIFFRRDALFL